MMFLHLKDFSATGHRKVSLKTADTDVVLITITLFYKLDLEELWIKFGTGVNLEWLPIHEYAENLGRVYAKRCLCGLLLHVVIPYPLSLGVASCWLGIHSNRTLLQQMHSKCITYIHFYYYLVDVIKY